MIVCHTWVLNQQILFHLIQYFPEIFHMTSLNFMGASNVWTGLQMFSCSSISLLGSLLCMCESCVSSHVNVHPQWVSRADVCDVIKGVKGSVHSGSCCGIHIEWNQTLEQSSSTFEFKISNCLNVVISDAPITCLYSWSDSDVLNSLLCVNLSSYFSVFSKRDWKNICTFV